MYKTTCKKKCSKNILTTHADVSHYNVIIIIVSATIINPQTLNFPTLKLKKCANYHSLP